ncbi:hypothetical protein TcCL_Unassigned00319 [Trypanosoma cruzi]|nr:hypothetical protein TcCL_Unassigned00319 [Trypanosoma cruzi]
MCPSTKQLVRTLVDDVCIAPTTIPRGKNCGLLDSPGNTGYGHSHAANTQRTRSEQSPKEPHAEAGPHPSMTRRLIPCGHTEHTISPIELILRPSLKNASVSDGNQNTIEKYGQCSGTATPPATMIPSYRGNSSIIPLVHTHNQHTI